MVFAIVKNHHGRASNPLQRILSLFLYGLLLSLWCFSILVTFFFQLSFPLKDNFVRGQIE